MSKSLSTSWRVLALSAVVGLSGLAVPPAEAGRVITSSDSGGGGGTGASAQARLFNCSFNNFGFASTDPFSCLGARSAVADFGQVRNLVDSRWSDWTSTDKSANVRSFTDQRIFFDTALAGDFALVLTGTWAGPLSSVATPWSAYYLLEDVEIKPQILCTSGPPCSPAEALRYNLEGTDLAARYSTTGILMTGVSLYQIERIPEPATLALVALALGGLAMSRRRAKRK